MSTFSSDIAEEEYRVFMQEFQTLRESIAVQRNEISALSLDIAHKQDKLHARRLTLLRSEIKLREITQIMAGET